MSSTSVPMLQPMSIGELLDRAVRLYRANFVTFVGIIAIVQVPMAAMELFPGLLMSNALPGIYSPGLGAPAPASSYAALGQCLAVLLAIVSFILVQGLGTAAITRAVADNYLGEPIGILSSYRKIAGVWTRLLGALILSAIYTIGLGLWMLVPCIGWFTGLGIIAFFSLAVTRLMTTIVVVEGLGGGSAIRRAWDLARRRFWPVTGFVAVLAIFALLIITGPATLTSFLLQLLARNTELFGRAATLSTVQAIAQSVVTLLFGLIYLPLELIGMTLLYYDLRARTEGFDLALLAAAELGPEAGSATLLAKAPAAQTGNLVTHAELGNFVILSIGYAAILGLVYGGGWAAATVFASGLP